MKEPDKSMNLAPKSTLPPSGHTPAFENIPQFLGPQSTPTALKNPSNDPLETKDWAVQALNASKPQAPNTCKRSAQNQPE